MPTLSPASALPSVPAMRGPARVVETARPQLAARRFYAVTLGSPLERPITKVPPDSYQQHRSIHDRGIDAKPPNRQRDAFTKYMESKMGIHATRSGDDPKKISKYIQNAGRVLRFFGSWIDTALFGRRHDLVIHYYLCDDTVEVRGGMRTGERQQQYYQQPHPPPPTTAASAGLG
eukprot:SAG31_NODE_2692_length_5239_cov_52.795525_2_plen_175_part_00